MLAMKEEKHPFSSLSLSSLFESMIGESLKAAA
jgi:hypothetical protein